MTAAALRKSPPSNPTARVLYTRDSRTSPKRARSSAIAERRLASGSRLLPRPRPARAMAPSVLCRIRRGRRDAQVRQRRAQPGAAGRPEHAKPEPTPHSKQVGAADTGQVLERTTVHVGPEDSTTQSSSVWGRKQSDLYTVRLDSP